MRRKDRQIINIKEIESIILKADVCRVAFADNNFPYIVTMNFGYSGGHEQKLYFHCAKEGRKIDILKKNSFVCFEFDIDHTLHKGQIACDFGMSYRSVLGWGNISVITDDEEKKSGLDSVMSHYSDLPGYSYEKKIFDRTLILRLDITEMTGKKS